jgi:hypothetical protein
LIKLYYDLISSFALKRAFQMKLCIFILSSLVLLYPTGITLAGDEEISATWINTDYNHFTFQKRVFNPDGTFRFYRYESSLSPEIEGTYSIIEKWTDSEKILWYKLKATVIKKGKSTEDYYYLSKISNSGKKLEFVFHASDYLKVINPDRKTYRIYFRH